MFVKLFVLIAASLLTFFTFIVVIPRLIWHYKTLGRKLTESNNRDLQQGGNPNLQPGYRGNGSYANDMTVFSAHNQNVGPLLPTNPYLVQYPASPYVVPGRIVVPGDQSDLDSGYIAMGTPTVSVRDGGLPKLERSSSSRTMVAPEGREIVVGGPASPSPELPTGFYPALENSGRTQ